MADSKQRILDIFLKEDLSIEELREKLGLSPTAVRHHLDSLEASGEIMKRLVMQKMGRPKFVYSLTEKGSVSFPKAYHEFLNWLMDELLEHEGVAGLKRLLTRAAKRNAGRYMGKFEGKSIEERVGLMGHILNELGAYAEIKRANGGFEIGIYNCLLSNIAKKYGNLICEYDATLLETLLGKKIKKIRSKTAGERFCSFLITK